MESVDTKKPGKEVIGQIAGYMRVGADFFLAAAACGIPERQAMEWKEKALQAAENDAGDIYHELFEAVRSAQAHAEVIALQRLSAEGGAAGAKWLLEKMNPGKYGKQQPGKSSGNRKKEAQGGGVSQGDVLQLDNAGDLGVLPWETLDDTESPEV